MATKNEIRFARQYKYVDLRVQSCSKHFPKQFMVNYIIFTYFFLPPLTDPLPSSTHLLGTDNEFRRFWPSTKPHAADCWDWLSLKENKQQTLLQPPTPPTTAMATEFRMYVRKTLSIDTPLTTHSRVIPVFSCHVYPASTFVVSFLWVLLCIVPCRLQHTFNTNEMFLK